MLIYVEGKNFSVSWFLLSLTLMFNVTLAIVQHNFVGQTFALQCSARAKLSKVKALLLHSLHDVGLGGHSFRLMFRNQYLKEPLTLEHYNISEMSVLQMVPVSFGRFSRARTASGVPRLTHHTAHPSHNAHLTPSPHTHNQQSDNSVVRNTVDALHREVKIFKHRVMSLKLLKVLLLLLGLLVLADFGTAYWWSALVTGFFVVLSILILPSFTYVSGSQGTMRNWDKWTMLVLAVIQFILVLFVCGLFLYLLLVDVLQSNCYSSRPSLTIFQDPTLALGCSGQTWLALVLYPLQSIMFLMASLVAIGIRINFNFEAGLLVEPTLSQTKPISELLQIAQQGRVGDKRQVAFELGSIALLGDHKKEEIASAGGYSVLISLITEEDTVTQEYAIEALTEVLSLQSIQNEFVSQRGVAILCALLCSPNQFVMERAAVALSHLTAHCSNNRVATVQEEGIDALVQAISQAPPDVVPIILRSLLHLAYCPLTISQLCAGSGLMKTLVGVLEGAGHEEETRIMVYQILNEIGKHQPSLIANEVKLVKYLLESLRWSAQEVHVVLPTLRLVMIFAEDTNRSKNLLETDFISILEGFLSAAESLSVHCPGLDLQVAQILDVLMQQEHLVAKLVCQGARRLLERLQKQRNNYQMSQIILNCFQILDE